MKLVYMGLASAAFAAAVPANAAIVLVAGNVPGSLDTVHLDGNNGATLVMGDVAGFAGGDEIVKIQGIEAISPSNDGGGQPWVVAGDGKLRELEFSLISGYTFSKISFNLVPLDAQGNTSWTATLFGYSPDGTASSPFTVKGNNEFNAYTTEGWVFTSVRFTSEVDLQGVGQIRIGGLATAVPEPASWAMMVGGFGLIGCALRRRQQTNLTFA